MLIDFLLQFIKLIKMIILYQNMSWLDDIHLFDTFIVWMTIEYNKYFSIRHI